MKVQLQATTREGLAGEGMAARAEFVRLKGSGFRKIAIGQEGGQWVPKTSELLIQGGADPSINCGIDVDGCPLCLGSIKF